MNINPVAHTLRIHPGEIWGPRYKAVEAMFSEWAKFATSDPMDTYYLDIPVPHVDDRVNKARWHCNPAYRK